MESAQARPASTASVAAQCAAPAGERVLSTAALFRSARSLVIEHAGERYVLSVTRNGKLILTK